MKFVGKGQERRNDERKSFRNLYQHPFEFLAEYQTACAQPGKKKKKKNQKPTGAEQFPKLTWGWKTVNSDQSGIQNWMEHLEHSEKNLERAHLKKQD